MPNCVLLVCCFRNGTRGKRIIYIPSVRYNDASYVYMRRCFTKQLLCSGALFKLNFAVTAARCVLKWDISTYGGRKRGYEVVAGSKSNKFSEPEDTAVYSRQYFTYNSGSISRSNITGLPEEHRNMQVQQVTVITIIKSYRSNFPFADDIAVVEVKESFFESAFVKPAQLSRPKLQSGTVLTTFGYGQTVDGARASRLTFEELEIVDRILCGNGPANYNWMCFREMHPLAKNLHDDCGDPIFFRQFLVGITSWVSLDNRQGFYIAQNMSSHEGYIRSTFGFLDTSKLRTLKRSAASWTGKIELFLFTVLYNILVL